MPKHFFTIFRTEVLLNSRRVAPYVLMILFAANAVLWWGRGPAVKFGWATNSEYYIMRNLQAFSFLLGLPIFNAIIMGDPVIRDFRTGVDPLVFSKPIGRAEYLLGKFCGSFFVLVCCQSAFVLTLILLQAFRTAEMIVQPVKVLVYFKLFFFFLVISHLVLAAFYFTVGTLTRNARIVYGLAVCFYPVYISYQVFLLKGLPPSWKTFLDPLLINSGPGGGGFGHSADFLNRYVVTFSTNMIANRGLWILVSGVFLVILYLRFSIAERSGNVAGPLTLNLSTATERVYAEPESLPATRGDWASPLDSLQQEKPQAAPLPDLTRANEGVRANISKLVAAVAVEFRLLRAERSLVVIMPLAIFLSTLELVFYEVVPEVSYSATYAGSTTRTLLLFLIGITVFYTGEAMHRDRELRIDSISWTMPVPNTTLLLSKFLTTLVLSLSLILLVFLTAIVTQIVRGHVPVDVLPYLVAYFVILIPNVAFLAGTAVALNVLLRDKYVAYAVSIATAGGLFYLYSLGYNHWLYNPSLYRLWANHDLSLAGSQTRFLLHRVYWLAATVMLLAIAHFCFERSTTRSLFDQGRLSGRGWSALMALVSVPVVVIFGFLIA